MEFNFSGKHLEDDPAAQNFIEIIRHNESLLGLAGSQVYYDFPLYRDLDGHLVISQILIISPMHGVIVIGTSNANEHDDVAAKLSQVEENLDKVFATLFSRLIRNTALRDPKRRTDLLFPAEAMVYAPFLEAQSHALASPTAFLHTQIEVVSFFSDLRLPTKLSDRVFAEVIATTEGSNALIRPKPREVHVADERSKGALVSRLEAAIASFDQKQKHGMMTVLDGPQRIRGLAGSGKTVVLAMKAAQMHLRFPDATILYTFHTRSLYQHIRRMITRFYRQFDDRDPDWDKLKVMHGWGGYNAEGVYSAACKAHQVQPTAYTEARGHSSRDPFGYVCSELLRSTDIRPMYDYVFVDEAQDFPNSFLKLCVRLAENSRVVVAYDELQTIFRTKAPGPSEYLDEGLELTDDVVLYKCYRNPREIIVCAHALGFGLYSSRIVQLLEDEGHWQDIGYEVIEGDFVEGSRMSILRPEHNSLTMISEHQEPAEIVKGTAYDDFWEEIEGVARGIAADIQDGLKPDDILVVSVDDKFSARYLRYIGEALARLDIQSNNIHEDTYGLRDFQKENRVTLSTVHKAKGNEAFMVYVVGVDALFSSYASVRERNMLFTAMTRAKGWVRVSGVGANAGKCVQEIKAALKNFPHLVFDYPTEAELNKMKRDLSEKAIRKLRLERQLDTILEELSPEEIESYISQRAIPKGDD